MDAMEKRYEPSHLPKPGGVTVTPSCDNKEVVIRQRWPPLGGNLRGPAGQGCYEEITLSRSGIAGIICAW